MVLGSASRQVASVAAVVLAYVFLLSEATPQGGGTYPGRLNRMPHDRVDELVQGQRPGFVRTYCMGFLRSIASDLAAYSVAQLGKA